MTSGRRTVSGSIAGSMKETQEMLDLCGEHNITCDIELVSTDTGSTRRWPGWRATTSATAS